MIYYVRGKSLLMPVDSTQTQHWFIWLALADNKIFQMIWYNNNNKKLEAWLIKYLRGFGFFFSNSKILILDLWSKIKMLCSSTRMRVVRISTQTTTKTFYFFLFFCFLYYKKSLSKLINQFLSSDKPNNGVRAFFFIWFYTLWKMIEKIDQKVEIF